MAGSTFVTVRNTQTGKVRKMSERQFKLLNGGKKKKRVWVLNDSPEATEKTSLQTPAEVAAARKEKEDNAKAMEAENEKLRKELEAMKAGTATEGEGEASDGGGDTENAGDGEGEGGEGDQ